MSCVTPARHDAVQSDATCAIPLGIDLAKRRFRSFDLTQLVTTPAFCTARDVQFASVGIAHPDLRGITDIR